MVLLQCSDCVLKLIGFPIMMRFVPIAELMMRQKMNNRACGVSHGSGSTLIRSENPQV